MFCTCTFLSLLHLICVPLLFFWTWRSALRHFSSLFIQCFGLTSDLTPVVLEVWSWWTIQTLHLPLQILWLKPLTSKLISSYLPFCVIPPCPLYTSTHRWNVANWHPQHRNTQQELHSCRRDPAAAGMRAPKSHFRAARWVSELTFPKLVCGAQRVLRQCAPGSAVSRFYEC